MSHKESVIESDEGYHGLADIQVYYNVKPVRT